MSDLWKLLLFFSFIILIIYTSFVMYNNPEGNYDQSNCRWTDKITQNTNTRLIHITNKSGYRGVSFYAPSQKWRACIQVQNKTHHIGLFVDKKDAALARDAYIITNKLPHPLNFKVINE